MFGKVTISTDIYLVTSPILFLTRLCCSLPVRIEKAGLNTSIAWSWLYYSLSLGTFACTMAWIVFGLVQSYGIDDVYKIRLSELSGKFITILDDSYLLLTFTLATMITPATFRHFCTYLTCLNKVDRLLKRPQSSEKRKFHVVLFITLALTLTILGLDMATWWSHVFNKHITLWLYLLCNIPFYYTYFLVMVIELNYWYMVQMINVRLADVSENLKNDYKEFRLNGIMGEAVEKRNNDVGGNVSVVTAPDADPLSRSISKSVKVYELLFEASESVNRFYGINILMVIVGCLIHLLVTPYDLYLELKFSNYTFILPQIFWMISHVLRLLLIVEPCHTTTQWVKQDLSLVYQFLSLKVPGDLHFQLETLATELFHCPIQFTAYELVVLDRSLLTKIAGGVTTYLVILFQFDGYGKDN